jgi:hypothetical protein
MFLCEGVMFCCYKDVSDHRGLITSEKRNRIHDIDHCITQRLQEPPYSRKTISCAIHLCERRPKQIVSATRHNCVASFRIKLWQ